MLGRNIYQVQNAFQQAGKGDELIALLEQTDLRQFGQPSMVFNLISNLLTMTSFGTGRSPFSRKRGRRTRISDRI